LQRKPLLLISFAIFSIFGFFATNLAGCCVLLHGSKCHRDYNLFATELYSQQKIHFNSNLGFVNSLIINFIST